MAKKKSTKPQPKHGPSIERSTASPSPKTPPQQEPSRLAEMFAKEWVRLLTVFVAAFCLRLIHVLLSKANSPFFDGPVTDSDFYDKAAVAIANGDWLGKDIFYVNPLYPYFLGGIYKIFGHSYLAAKLVQITIGSMSCLLIYQIAWRLFSKQTALIAALLAAFYSVFIYYDELLLATVLDVFTYTASVLLLLIAIEKPTFPRFAAAGMVLGISFVSRPSVFPFVAAFWIVYCLKDRAKTFIIARLAVFSVIAALMVLPVTVRNYVVGDDLVLVSSHTGYNFYFGNNAETTGYFVIPKSIPRALADSPADQKKWFTKEAEKAAGKALKPSEVSDFWAKKGWEYIAEHPGDWLGLAFGKLARLINEFEFSDNQNYYFSKQYSVMLEIPLIGFGLICPLALLGLLLCARDFKRVGILHLFVAGYAAALVFFFVSSRYRLPLVPVFLVFAAHSLLWMIDKLEKKDFKQFLFALALLACFTAAAFSDLRGINKNPQFIDYYNVGNKYLAKGRLEEAVKAYTTSIKMGPNYISSYNNLASCYEKAGRIDDALEEWKIVFEMGEKINSEAHIRRAAEHIDVLSRKTSKSVELQ
jgi:4-amino-4-deoxy-L-arabinose transferase-like glycosyltransferase